MIRLPALHHSTAYLAWVIPVAGVHENAVQAREDNDTRRNAIRSNLRHLVSHPVDNIQRQQQQQQTHGQCGKDL